MGYTHYWYQKGNVAPEVWGKITEAVEKIIAATPKVQIKREYNSISPPLINNHEIIFNGSGDLGHETFLLNRDQEPIPEWQKSGNLAKLGTFSFCKTAHKPYDLLVCAVLLVAKHHAGEVFTLSSDGDWDFEWKDASDLVRDELGIKFETSPFRAND